MFKNKIENILIQNIFLANQYRHVFISQRASYRTLPTYWWYVAINDISYTFRFYPGVRLFVCLSNPMVVVVDGSWMQTHSRFNFHAAKTKSHCSAHHGGGYLCTKTWKRTCRGLHLSPEIRSVSLIDPDLTLLFNKKKKCIKRYLQPYFIFLFQTSFQSKICFNSTLFSTPK